MLREKDVSTAPDLIKVTPGLTAQLGANQSRRTSRFAIRGQGTTGLAGVSAYFADVPDIGTPFYDLQNVQVLKGPVGTLFGRVNTGGAILFTPQMPGNDFEGYGNFKVGQYGRRDIEFGVTAPIAPDLLTVRVSGQFLKSRGFSRNLYDNSWQDGRDGQSYRLIAKFTPASWLTNTTILLADYIEDPTRSGVATIARQFNSGNAAINRGNTQRIAPIIAQLNGIACPGNICPTWLEYAQGQVAAAAGRSHYVVNENNVGYGNPNMRQLGLINTTVFDLGPDVSIKNIFSRQRSKGLGPTSVNIDGLGLPMLEQINATRGPSDGLTEELQLQGSLFDDRLEFTSGFYYEKNWMPYYLGGSNIFYGGYLAQSTTAAGCAALGARADAGPDGAFYCWTGAQTSMARSRSVDKAVYTQATLNVTDQLSLTAGYRYTWSNRRSASQTISSLSPLLTGGTIESQWITMNGAPPFLVPGSRIKSLPGEVYYTVKSKKGTYTLAAQYQFSKDFMVYATTRSGYNPGGRNSRFASGFEFYAPETVTDYEIGAKLGWHSGDFSGLVSFDAYRENYNNAQRSVTQPVNGTPTVFLANVARARIQGFDFDGSINYGWFNLGAFVTLTDGKYLEYPNGGNFPQYPVATYPNLTFFNLAGVSKWVWGIRPTIDFSKMGADIPKIALSGNIYHRGTFYSSEPNTDLESERTIPSNTQLDLRLDWRDIAGSHFSAAFAVTNVTNFNGKVGGNELRATNGINIDVYAPPRQWYVELGYKF
jgi:iron complex outermembrane receptor protein